MAVDSDRFIAALVALLAFGHGYNILVTWLHQQSQDHGYTAFLVIGGTLVTMAGLAWIVDLRTALIGLACFAASGSPLIIGSVRRSLQRRAAAIKLLDDQAREALRDH